MDEIKEEDRDELVDILDKYFDPEKEAAAPAVTKQKSRLRRRSYRKGSEKENRKQRNPNNNNNNDGESNGEHTSSETRSPRKNRRSRRRTSGGKRDSSKTKIENTKLNTATEQRLVQLPIQVAAN